MLNPQEELNPPAAAGDEKLQLPCDSIKKIIKELVPSVRVANKSRDLILNSCTEFIHLITSKANEVCNQRNRKIISAEHVLEALDDLGFGDFRQDAETVLNDFKEINVKRRQQSTRLENLGIPEEELLRQQEALFDKARKEQAAAEQAQWSSIQVAAMQQNAELLHKQQKAAQADVDDDEDEY